MTYALNHAGSFTLTLSKSSLNVKVRGQSWGSQDWENKTSDLVWKADNSESLKILEAVR